MQFNNEGRSRFVILIGDRAIKIGRLRPIRIFFKLIRIMIFKEHRVIFMEEYGKIFLPAVLKYLIAGIIANRNEYHYYQKYRDRRAMPTVKIYFGGYLIIQERGKEITQKELEREHPLPLTVVNSHYSDLQEAKQYCRCQDGSIRVVDYGRKATCEALRCSLAKT